MVLVGAMSCYRQCCGLIHTKPVSMRYVNGVVAVVIPHGSARTSANFVRVTNTFEIAPSIRVMRNISANEQFSETPDVSLVSACV